MTIAQIAAAASDIFGVPVRVLMGKAQDKSTRLPRFAVYWVARNHLGYSYPQIGRIMDRDHSTVVHGVARAEALRATNDDFRRAIDRLATGEYSRHCPCCGQEWGAGE